MDYFKSLAGNKAAAYRDLATNVAKKAYAQVETKEARANTMSVLEANAKNAAAAKVAAKKGTATQSVQARMKQKQEEFVRAEALKKVAQKRPSYAGFRGETTLSAAPTGMDAFKSKLATTHVKAGLAAEKGIEVAKEVGQTAKAAGLGAVAQVEKTALTGALMASETDWSFKHGGAVLKNALSSMHVANPITGKRLGRSSYVPKTHDETDFENVLKDSLGGWDDIQQKEYGKLEHTWQKKTAALGQSAVTMLGAIGITVATKSPSMGAALMTAVDSSDVYNEARAAGKTPAEATAIFSESAAGSYLLERVGFGNIFKKVGGGGAIKRFAEDFASEGLQEGTQLAWQDYVAKKGFGKENSSLEEYWDSVWMGGVIGGGAGAITSSSEMRAKNKVVKDLKSEGLSTEEATEAIDKFKAYSMSVGSGMIKRMSSSDAMGFNRTAGLRGLDQGTPGIDYAAPLQGVPSDKIAYEDLVDQNVKENRSFSVQKSKTDLVNYLKDKLPIQERGRFQQLIDIKNVKTWQDAKVAIARVDKVVDKFKAREAVGKIESLIKGSKARVESGKPIKKMDIKGSKAFDILKEGIAQKRTHADAQMKSEELLSKYEDTPIDKIPADVLEQAHLLSISGLKGMDSKQAEHALAQWGTIDKESRTKFQKELATKRSYNKGMANKFVSDITGGLGIDPTAVNESQRVTKKGLKEVAAKAGESVSGAVTGFAGSMHGLVSGLENLTIGRGRSDFFGSMRDNITEARTNELTKKAEFDAAKQDAVSEAYGVNTTSDYKKVMKDGRKVEALVTKSGEKVGRNMTHFQMVSMKALDLARINGDANVAETFDNMGIDSKTLDALDNTMTEGDKALANILVDKVYPAIRETSEPLFEKKTGTAMPTNIKYSPQARKGAKGTDVDIVKMMNKGDVVNKTGMTPSSMRNRTGTTSEFLFLDAMRVLDNQIDQVSHDYGYGDVINTLNSVFGNKKVADAMRQEGKSHMLQNMKTQLDNLARGGLNMGKFDRALVKQNSRFVKAKMLGSFMSLPKQLISGLTSFSTDLNTSEVTKGYVNVAKNYKAYRKIFNDNIIIKDRKAHGDTIEMNIALRDSPSIGGLSTVGKVWEGIKMPTKVGDPIGFFLGAAPVYDAYYNRFKKTMSDKEASDKAMTKSIGIMLELQQSGGMESISALQGASGFFKLATAFQTSQIQMTRATMNLWKKMQSGQISKGKALRGYVTINHIIPMMFQWMADGFEWDKENQLTTFMLGPLQNVPVLGPVLKMGIMKYQGNDFFEAASSVMPMMGVVGTLGKGLVSAGKGDTKYATKYLGSSIGDIFGLPTNFINRMSSAVPDLITGESADPRRLLVSSYALGDNEMLGHKGSIDKAEKDADSVELADEVVQDVKDSIRARVKDGSITAEEGVKAIEKVDKNQKKVKNRNLIIDAVKGSSMSTNQIKGTLEKSYDLKMINEADAKKVVTKMEEDGVVNEKEASYLLEAANALSER